MAQWSKLWELPKAQRDEALKAARFTPPSQKSGKAKHNPAHQQFRKKDD
jgi:hypothetical protein